MGDRKQNHGMTDAYVIGILLVTYLVLDVLYPTLQYRMGIQLSDWWLAANVVVAIVEFICLTVNYIAKHGGFKKNGEYKQLVMVLAQLVGALAGSSITVPDMTSGEKGRPADVPDREDPAGLDDDMADVYDPDDEEEAAG